MFQDASLLYRAARIFLRATGKLYFRWEIEGAHHIPRTGPVLLACNHLSYLDPPVIGAAVPREVHFLARKTLFDVPILKHLIPRFNALPIDRDGGGGAGLKTTLELMNRGGALILFPEGTRSRDGQLQSVHPGMGLTAIKSGATVVPVRISGTFESFGRHRRFPRPSKIRIHFGEPIDLTALQAEAAVADRLRIKAIYHEVADRVLEAIRNLGPSSSIPNS